MNAYLPAGSEIVILRNGQREWYTTQQTVSVSNYTVAPCPLRNALPVLTAEVKGYRVWFLEGQLEVELNDEQKNFILAHKFIALEYDIPARVSQRPQDYPDEQGNSFVHPSQWMWGYGVRTTLSCWMLTEEKYNASLRRLRSLTRAGCNWRRTKIDTSDAARHYMSAVVQLRKEWLAADVSYNEGINRAEQEWQESNRGIQAERKRRYAETRIEKAFEEKRKNIQDGARLMGIPMDWITKATQAEATGSTVVRNITLDKVQKQISKTEAEAHCEMVDAMKSAGYTNEAELVEQGSMPKAIAADFCEDKGILCDEDGTFSLRDVFKD